GLLEGNLPVAFRVRRRPSRSNSPKQKAPSRSARLPAGGPRGPPNESQCEEGRGDPSPAATPHSLPKHQALRARCTPFSQCPRLNQRLADAEITSLAEAERANTPLPSASQVS